MAVLPIRQYPDEMLRRECSPVETFDGELRQLAADMVETMYAAPGVGLAASQVGIDLRLAVVDVTVGEEEGALIVMINPEVVDSAYVKQLREGMTTAEVTAMFGQPQRQASVGNKTLYFYKDVKVTFTDKKGSGIE